MYASLPTEIPDSPLASPLLSLPILTGVRSIALEGFLESCMHVYVSFSELQEQRAAV